MNEIELMRRLKDSRSFRKLRIKSPFSITRFEHPIWINGNICGYVDIIGKFRGQDIAIEVKGTRGEGRGGPSIFWDASKILAYVKILARTSGKHYHPGVLIPKEAVSVEVMTMAAYLGMDLFSYSSNEETGGINLTDVFAVIKTGGKHGS
jgi:hypothetical protein